MKPIKLELSAFGPYLNKVEIDFTRLQDNGLYLVSGDTGSGKTMIFDAISYALYNKTSGGKRTSKDLRTVTATTQTTYVDYSFEVNGRVMRIKRTPEQVVTADEKEKKVRSSYQLFIDGQEVDLSRDYGIPEIVGINYEEFTQIVMIAQNDFMKLINSNEKERTAILKKLFKIPNMSQFNIFLKERADAAKNEFERINKNIADITASHEIDSAKNSLEAIGQLEVVEDGLVEMKTSLETKSATQEAKLLELSTKLEQVKNINGLFVKLEQAQNRLAELENSYDTGLEAKIELLKVAKDLKPDHDNLENSQKNLVGLKSEYEAKIAELQLKKDELAVAESEVAKEPEYKKANEKLRGEVNELTRLIEQMKTKVELEQRILILRESIAKLVRDKADLTAKQSELDLAKTKLDQFINQENRNLELKNSLENQLQKQKELDHKIDEFLQEKQNLTKLTSNHLSAVEQYRNLDRDYQKAASNFEAAQKANNDYAVGFIAANLVANQPCPVCGSLEHPSIAPLSGKEITKEELERLKLAQDRIQKCLNDQVASTSAIKAKLESKQETVTKLQEEIGGGDDVQAMHEKCREAIEELSASMLKVKAYFVKLPDQKAELEQLAQRITANDSQISSLENQQSTNKGILQQLEEQLAKMPQIAMSISQLETIASSKKEAIEANETTIAANNKIFHELDNLVAGIKAAIEAKKAQIETQKELIEKYRHKYQEKMSQVDYPEIIILENFQEVTHLSEYEKYVANYRTELGAIKSQIAVYQGETKDQKVEEEQQYQLAIADSKNLTMKIKEEANTVNAKLAKVSEDLSKMRSYTKLATLAEERLAIYDDLYRTSKGQIAGQKKLEFETYLVYSYFEELLTYANAIFADLTNNRYQFVVSEPESKGKSYNFILGVLDRENSKTRLARTLSGGETFKAALSLSIGLSRLVQDKSGTVELNSIFIDEGFGTLDDNSLNQAINCLQSIRLENQMIGIISHVNILKERIDNKIVVRKDGETSNIEIIEA